MINYRIDNMAEILAELQRNGALNLNIHLHALVLDGVFTMDGRMVAFHPMARLTREDLQVFEHLASWADRSK